MTSEFAELLLGGGEAVAKAENDLFGRLVGSWDLDVAWYEGGKLASNAKGEWHFARILDGRAIQDIWIVPTLAEQRAGKPVYEFGTSIRFPDPSGNCWRSTWHGPVRALIVPFIARRSGQDIVMESKSDGAEMRWSFSSITSESFYWSNEIKVAHSDSWLLTQDFRAKRR